MKTVRFINDRSEAQRAVIIPDGRMVALYDENNQFMFSYDRPFNLKTGEILPFGTTVGGDIATLNSLAGWPDHYKKLEEVQCYDMHDIECGFIRNLSKKKKNEIVVEFRQHGFDVDPQDVQNLYDSWHAGWKTGIRNEERGYHLFCPCGCNPFSVRLSTLHPMCKDWQTTYWC